MSSSVVSTQTSSARTSPSDGQGDVTLEPGGGSGAETCLDTRPRHPDGGPYRWTCDGEWHRGWSGHDPFAYRCPNARKSS